MHRYAEKTLPGRPSRLTSGFYLLMTLLIAGSLMGIIYLALLEDWYGEVLIVRAGASLPAAWANGQHVWLGDFPCPQNSPSPELEQWKRLLQRHRIPFSATRQIPDGPVGVLVLPSAECLAVSEQVALRQWLTRGGGVVATGWPGRREPEGRAENNVFAADVFGIQPQGETACEASSVTLANEFPLGLGLAPGQTWQIENGHVTCGLGSVSAGYWSDGRFKTAANDSAEDRTAITYHAYAKGRAVWIGPGLHGVSLPSQDRPSWEKLFLNSLHWAGRRTLAGVSFWPSGNPAAAVIAGEVRSSADLATATKAARELGAIGLASTLFLDPQLFDHNVSFSQLDQRAEMALLLDASAIAGATMSGLGSVRQKFELTGGRSLTGVRATGADLSPRVREDLVRQGFLYQVTSAPVQKSAPEIQHSLQSALFPLDRRNFVVLPQTARDDFAVLSQYSGTAGSTADIADFLKLDFASVDRTRGLYVLTYRMDLLGSDQNRPAILAFAKHLRDQGVWVATAAEVARWWIALEEIEVYSEKVSPRRIRVTVRNSSDHGINGLRILVGLPYAPSAVNLLSTVFWAEPVSLHLVRDSDRLEIHIPQIKPQSTSTWLVDLY